MKKYGNLFLTAILILVFIFAYICTGATGITALAAGPSETSSVMEDDDTTAPSDVAKEEPQVHPSGEAGREDTAQPEGDQEATPETTEDEPAIQEENPSQEESVVDGASSAPSDAVEYDTSQSNGDVEQPGDSDLQAEAGTLKELMEQLTTLSGTGGTLRLTADIQVPPDTNEWYIGDQGGPMIDLDVGEYTIYVDGTLKLYPYLTISGKGGENGLLQVRDGGELYLCGVSLDAQEGYAVYQQDGGFLNHGNDGFTWGVDFS